MVTTSKKAKEQVAPSTIMIMIVFAQEENLAMKKKRKDETNIVTKRPLTWKHPLLLLLIMIVGYNIILLPRSDYFAVSIAGDAVLVGASTPYYSDQYLQ